MKYVAVSIVLVAVLAVIVFFTVEKRQVGERDVCEACSKVVTTDVRERFLPVWDTSKVTVNHVFCNQCGNEQVTITRAQQCRNCGKLYDVNKQTALRKDRKQDMITKTGFCSDACSHKTVTVSQKCEWCGKVYDRFTKTVAFDSSKRDSEVTRGFCSSGCQNRRSLDNTKEKAKDAADKTGRAVGEGMEKLGRWLQRKKEN